jgi:hypothetical protein
MVALTTVMQPVMALLVWHLGSLEPTKQFVGSAQSA